ncbi:class I SAM-dependent methyltransferase [candidate division CSSED10-310 bacterium]|uniref:Class I SAM-dependent methyltransferase n=1 Tax=candidate division CSSED10-310 bacterium TaxID=2855610 RepID=A0ABV6YUG2_UNCC1
MNYERIYEYRFKEIPQTSRAEIWRVITPFIEAKLKFPRVILDPAAGRGEFLNASQATEKWAVDPSAQIKQYGAQSLRIIQQDIREVDLPDNYFDGIFLSNFLEHLPSPEAIAQLLLKMYQALQPGKRLVVMGPNFKRLLKQYFDCADHIVPLTEISAAEQLYGAGFTLVEITKTFLPYTFRGWLPPSPMLTRFYLKMPLLWLLFGKQYLIVAQKP